MLADKSTASAGEIIAAALTANKRGELVGERTFGAGAEQKLFDLKGGAALLLTVTKYADPQGNPFIRENGGVAPTIEVKAANDNEDVLPADDDQDSNQEQNQEDAEPVLPIEPAPTEDLMLKKALELLKGTSEKRAAQNNLLSPSMPQSLVHA